MNVTCPRCFALYNVPENFLAEKPRRMRCSSCKNEWTEAAMPKSSVAEFAPQQPTETAITPPSEDMAQPSPRMAEPPQDQSYLRPRREKQVIELAKPPKTDYVTPLAWFFFTLASIAGVGALLHTPLSRLSPTIANFYEDIGLPADTVNEWFKFDDIKVEKSIEDGASVLSVRGFVYNISQRQRTVPPLQLYWLGKDGQKSSPQILKTNPATLTIGDKAFFSGRLTGIDASLGGEVKVTFAEKVEAAEDHAAKPAHGSNNSGHAAPHDAPAPAAHHSAAPAESHTAHQAAEPAAAHTPSPAPKADHPAAAEHAPAPPPAAAHLPPEPVPEVPMEHPAPTAEHAPAAPETPPAAHDVHDAHAPAAAAAPAPHH